ncbi:hypothetical protein I546_1817 [Mycobacterium kansasii 732]|nr:hypothetical protein I546_1817 [Mycobacterium kansasii 732]
MSPHRSAIRPCSPGPLLAAAQDNRHRIPQQPLMSSCEPGTLFFNNR